MALLTERILQYLNQHETADTLKLADEFKEDHQKVIGALKSLESLEMVEGEKNSMLKTELTAEGKSFVEKGSHEAIVFAAVPPGEAGIPQPELMKITGAAGKIGMSKALQNGWLKIVKEGGNKVVRSVDSIEDSVRAKLQAVANGDTSSLDTAALADLKKRKLLTQIQVVFYDIKKGKEFTLQVVKLDTELTPEMLSSGEWRQKKFKAYNFNSEGTPLPVGSLHPLLKVRSEFRSILLEMGFSEMPTNRYVESSFWNFDALYVPQKHPARDAQDTFFVSQPDKCKSVPQDYMKRVRAAHTGEDYDTLGYGPDWKEEEAYKNCLRTHTTAVSARMLHAIGSQPEFKPAKLFSIDRVYRNETLDATHLAEFHQVEGVVADYDLNLGNLIAIMKEFFSRLGLKRLRFKPAYNPYTEPSMEVFSYHPGLQKWVEIGNSGMFRPEMLLPMGIPKDVRVIAWGLSLERPTMIRYSFNNIRDLVGPKVDLGMVHDCPIINFETNYDFDIDNLAGSYLDNPLLKSPTRKKTATSTATGASSLPQEDQPKKSKNRRKRKKNKTASETQEGSENVEATSAGGGDVGNSKNNNKSSQENIKPQNKTAQQQQSQKNKSVQQQQPQTTKLKDNKSGEGSEAGGGESTAEDKAAARLKVISNHLQAGSSSSAAAESNSTQSTNPTPGTSKSSKRKRKPKVKSAEAPSSSQQ